MIQFESQLLLRAVIDVKIQRGGVFRQTREQIFFCNRCGVIEALVDEQQVLGFRSVQPRENFNLNTTALRVRRRASYVFALTPCVAYWPGNSRQHDLERK
jgi:hypothetical protein